MSEPSSVAGWNIPMSYMFYRKYIFKGSIFQPAMLDYRSVPSRELRYPTLGKAKPSKVPAGMGDMIC